MMANPQDDITPAPPLPTTATSGTDEPPWHAKYPAPRAQPATISRHELLQLLKAPPQAGQNLVLVDLRRADHEGGTIAGSINLPAQSLFPTIPSLYRLFAAAGVASVIWYRSSSRGRGNRAAAWFADYVAERQDSKMKSMVLTGGIKGWVGEKGEFLQSMQEYDPVRWV